MRAVLWLLVIISCVQSAPFFDDFNRPDQNLSNIWTPFSGLGNLVILHQRLGIPWYGKLEDASGSWYVPNLLPGLELTFDWLGYWGYWANSAPGIIFGFGTVIDPTDNNTVALGIVNQRFVVQTGRQVGLSLLFNDSLPTEWGAAYHFRLVVFPSDPANVSVTLEITKIADGSVLFNHYELPFFANPPKSIFLALVNDAGGIDNVNITDGLKPVLTINSLLSLVSWKDKVNYTVTIIPTPPLPFSQVNFLDNGNLIGSATIFKTDNGVAKATLTKTITQGPAVGVLTPVTHSIVATYNGLSSAPFILKVYQGRTQTNLTTNKNSYVIDETVTATAVVTKTKGVNTFTPTEVLWKLNGGNLKCLAKDTTDPFVCQFKAQGAPGPKQLLAYYPGSASLQYGGSYDTIWITYN